MGIFIKHGEQLIAMTPQPYDAEAVLQRLIAEHPALLAGGDDERSWLLVRREIAVGDDPASGGRWSLDHLFLDQDGVPTLVEVKRSSSREIRRAIVGQMLDYAANAPSYWAVEQLRQDFESTHAEAGRDPRQILMKARGVDDPDEFWRRVDANLQARRLRLVFVADEIPSELAAVVEFLNEQMPRVDVLAIEVRQYRADESDLLTLVPRVIGRTEAARSAKLGTAGRMRRAWSQPDFEEAIRDSTPEPFATRLLALHEALLRMADRVSWGVGQSASCTVKLGEERGAAVSVAIYASPPSVVIDYEYAESRRDSVEMERLAAIARQLPGVAPYIVDLERNWRKRPGMAVTDVLPTDAAVGSWITGLEEASHPAAAASRREASASS